MNSQLYCDVALAFGCWLEMLMQLEIIPALPVIQTASTLNCQRPLLWYEQTDSDKRERCLDPQTIYVPTYVGIDLEAISDDGDMVEDLAGNIRAACSRPELYKQSRWGPILDDSGNEIYPGCRINRITATGHNADYQAKAPGIAESGEFGIATFIEIHTKR